MKKAKTIFCWFIHLNFWIFILGLPGPALCADLIVRSAVSTELRYDSNTFIRPEGETVNDDFIMFLSPQVEVVNDRNRLTLTGFYRARQSLHYKYPEIDTLSHYASLAMDLKVSPQTTVGVGDRFTYTEESLEESLDASTSGIQTRRTGIISNTVFLNTTHAFTAYTSMSLNLSDSVLEFEDPVSTDSRADSVGITATHNTAHSTSLTTNYTYTTFTSFPPGGSSTQIDNHYLRLGISHQLLPTINMFLSGGAVYAPDVNEYYDWVARAEISKSFEKSSIGIGYTRTTTHTMGLTNLLNLSERYSIRWNYTPGRIFNVTLFGDYYRNNTKPVDLIDMTAYRFGIGSGWQPYTWLSMHSGYAHYEQSAEGSLGQDSRRDNVFLTATFILRERRF